MLYDDEQNKSLIRSIFDFILAANKRTSPQKPLQKSPAQVQDEMAKALAEIASAPSVYANDQSLEVVKETVSQPSQKTDKAVKQVNAMRGSSGAMDLGLGAVVARASGASESEALTIGWIIGGEAMPKNERNANAKQIATRTSVLETLAAKGLDYGKANQFAQTFSSLMDSSSKELAGKDLMNLSKADRVRLEATMTKKLSSLGISPDQIDFDKLLTNYIERAQKYSKDYTKGWDLGKLNKGITDINDNPAEKLRDLKMEEIQAELSFLEKLPDGNPEKQKRIRLLRQLEIWKKANSSNSSLSRRFGQASLNLQRLNSGQEFSKAEIVFKGHRILVSQSPFQRGLISLQYLAPGAIAKTLFLDGKGFAYSAYLKEQDLKEMIAGSESLFDFVLQNRDLFSPLESLKGVDLNNQKRVLQALGGDYGKLIGILNANRNLINDPELLRVLDGIGKLNNKLNNSAGLKWAGFLQEYIGGMVGLLQKRLIMILGEKLSSGLKSLMISGSLGLRGLFRKIFRGFGSAVGFATGGDLTNIVVYFTTEIMDKFRDHLLKPMTAFLRLTGFVLLSFVLILMASSFSIFDGINPFAPLRGVHIAQIVEPTAIVKCARGGGPIVAGVSESALPNLENVECPLKTEGSLSCLQGPYKESESSLVNSIIVTSTSDLFWHAPADGVITKSEEPQECGGVVYLKSEEHKVTYILMNVLPYVVVDQKISKGDLIAKMATENSCFAEPVMILEVLSSDIYADLYYIDVLKCNLGSCLEQ